MQLLVVSLIFPYPITSGGARDIYTRLEALHEAGYEIDLIATVRDPPSESDLNAIRPMVNSIQIVRRHRKISDLISAKPFQCETRGDLRTIPLEGEYLASIIESELVGGILDNPTLCAKHRILRIHNDEAHLARSNAASSGNLKERILFWVESLKFRLYSPSLIRKCDVLWHISSAEMKRFSAASINGTGKRHQTYLIRTIYNPRGFQRRSLQGASVLYVGALSISTNYDGLIWYLKHVHPRMLGNPGYQFVLAGMRGSANIDGLLETVRISERVVFRPDAEDLRGLYAGAAAFVNPIQRGAGVKIKTLDAVVEGMPVVTTSVGAEGTGFEDGLHAVVADSPELFSAGLQRIIADKTYAQQLVANAQALLERENQPSEMLQSLKSLN
jgi:glycosyltransferase involved in cell wall biosynthesis